MPKVPITQPARTYIGLDPGKQGGIVVLLASGEVLATPLASLTETGIWELIEDQGFQEFPVVFAVLEKVGGFIQGNPAPGSYMFNFGVSYGILRMALIAAGIPFEEVPPQRWQKALGIPKKAKSETKEQFKRRLKAKAEQLFPQVKVTLAIADALLIAEFARRTYGER